MVIGAIVISLSSGVLVGTYLLFSIYFLVFTAFAIGFFRKRKSSEKRTLVTRKKTAISVIIAARNEQENLSFLLSDLDNQEYPRSDFDIILIDDHSDVEIAEYINVNGYKQKNISILQLPEGKTGKKAALVYAAGTSNAEILAFTDADCRVQESWLASINEEFTISMPDLLIGLVDFLPSRGFLQGLFRLDFLSLVSSGAGAATLGRPVFCNGANLAVNREVYDRLALNLNVNTPSGDDVFLLHEIKREGLKAAPMISRESVVYTQAPLGIRPFLNQRVRWASKSKYYYDIDTIMLGVLVVLVNLIFMGVCIQLVINGFNPAQGGPLILKIAADCILLASGLSFFKGSRQFWVFPIAELIYPVYILISLFASIRGIYSWKGRNY